MSWLMKHLFQYLKVRLPVLYTRGIYGPFIIQKTGILFLNIAKAGTMTGSRYFYFRCKNCSEWRLRSLWSFWGTAGLYPFMLLGTHTAQVHRSPVGRSSQSPTRIKEISKLYEIESRAKQNKYTCNGLYFSATLELESANHWRNQGDTTRLSNHKLGWVGGKIASLSADRKATSSVIDPASHRQTKKS